eukprot:CAMPEP_0114662348 /NCGR_PEP_ID=MMETSP0191-20121206/24641_1 /TAXON_ID=126664 /ORGANISM="Sorites sp." /LENGTH=43 /DNA_ID= /DNA_START= /DNA_END= /DNA_ORIENTATION=
MASRYGVRQILHEEGFEIPYQMVPDGVRAMQWDYYPNPGVTHW